MRINTWQMIVLSAVVFSMSLAVADAETKKKMFSIEAQPARHSLTLYARQAQVQLGFAADVTDDVVTNAVIGEYDVSQALELLLEGTGLQAEHGERGIIIRPVPRPESAGSIDEPASAVAETTSLRLVNTLMLPSAQASTTSDGGQSGTNEHAQQSQQLDNIIVTGTSIRGVTNPASPVISFDREDILSSGLANLGDFVQTIPQNFSGGFTDGTANVPGAPGDNGNVEAGTGIDLRGLGADSTLILVNGRRLAPAGIGRFTDVSTIPASAIERIEIVLDGASAIYGSDAVGGVVNIMLRDDFEGAETQVRYGSVTDGNHDSLHASQAFGASWDTGNVFANYEYSSQSPLQNTDRSYTEQSPFPYDLTNDTEQHNVFVAVSQELFEETALFATANYSTRDVLSNQTSVRFTRFFDTSVDTYGGLVGLEWDLPGSWLAEISTAFNHYESSTVREIPEFANISTASWESEVWSWDAKADGDLFELTGGTAKLAIGAGTRNEKFQRPPSVVGAERDVQYLYAESIFPIIGPNNSIAGVNSLELSAAIRYEDYEGIGSSSDGKVGLVWGPTQSLQIRGTYGTSFRAPLLFEAAPLSGITTVRDSIDPQSSTGTTPGLFIFGNALSTAAPELGTPLTPEESEMFTIGVDFTPDFWPGFSASVSYFDIDFTDRIATARAFPSNVLVDPAYLPGITFNPTPAQVADAIAASEDFVNFTDIPDEDLTTPGVLGYIYDGRTANIATTANSGFDLQLGYSREVAQGTLGLTISGTYLTELEDRITSTAVPLDRLNTFQNPIDLRLRAGLSWSQRTFGSNLFINYADSYRDNRQDPEAGISSFTTVDWTISYEFDKGNTPSPLDNVRLLFSAVNILDEDPPLVDNPLGLNANFDARNASPLGRVLALQITKQWMGK